MELVNPKMLVVDEHCNRWAFQLQEGKDLPSIKLYLHIGESPSTFRCNHNSKLKFSLCSHWFHGCLFLGGNVLNRNCISLDHQLICRFDDWNGSKLCQSFTDAWSNICTREHCTYMLYIRYSGSKFLQPGSRGYLSFSTLPFRAKGLSLFQILFVDWIVNSSTLQREF